MKSTDNVIKWANKINKKNSYMITKFDIEEFYPSISKNLLPKAIEFIKKYTKITNSCKTVPIHDKEV